MEYILYFFFNDTATTEIYTLSLHDALPISPFRRCSSPSGVVATPFRRTPTCSGVEDQQCERPGHDGGSRARPLPPPRDRKSTRLNSSHVRISYAVFCFEKNAHYLDVECIESKL